MTFLNPLALFGLLAAAIPILLHLFNLRKLRTVEFSTLSFLKELEKTKIRRLKLRQILLMILRTLLVLLIALAFARPTLRGSLAGDVGSHARTSAVLLIDDSFSMTTDDEHGELLKQARQTAKELTQLFAEGDEAFLLRLSTLSNPVSLDETGIRDFALLRKQIDEIKPSAIHRTLEEGLRLAARFVAQAQNYNKEVFVISDFQEGVILADKTLRGQNENLFPAETRLFLVSLGKRALQNFAVESVTIPSSIFERQKPFNVRAQIANHSTADVQDRVVSVFLNGTRVAERSIDIPKRASVPVEFSVAVGDAGFVNGFVELEHDDVEYDNKRFFALRIPKRTNVLVVGNSDETRMVELALMSGGPAESGLSVEEVTPARLNSVEIKRADVVILGTTQGFTTAQISEVASFTKSGGGTILFPSSTVDPAGFNAQFASVLGAPRIESIDRPAGTATSASFVEFDRADLRHPLFEGVFEPSGDGAPRPSPAASDTKKLESPRIRASVKYALSAQASGIITMTNGSAFLAELGLGSGRLLLFAVPPTGAWSDFPTRGLFVPLLHRSALYLARQQSRAPETLPGSEIILRSSAAASGPWEIRTPRQFGVPVTPTIQLFQQLFRFNVTDQPGIYSLAAQGATVQQFVVNLDARESQTVKAAASLAEELIGRVGIQRSSLRTVESAEELKQGVLQSRFGVELWKYFVTLALMIAVLELLVARTWKREIAAAAHHD
jgi:hypothetical protein